MLAIHVYSFVSPQLRISPIQAAAELLDYPPMLSNGPINLQSGLLRLQNWKFGSPLACIYAWSLQHLRSSAACRKCSVTPRYCINIPLENFYLHSYRHRFGPILGLPSCSRGMAITRIPTPSEPTVSRSVFDAFPQPPNLQKDGPCPMCSATLLMPTFHPVCRVSPCRRSIYTRSTNIHKGNKVLTNRYIPMLNT